MAFSITPFSYVLSLAVRLHATIIETDSLWMRPTHVTKVVAARIRSGVRALEAFLRRVLILMALEMEADLVAKPQVENLKRPKAGKFRVSKPQFRPFPDLGPPFSHELYHRLEQLPAPRRLAHGAHLPPVQIPIRRWLMRLDHLHAIATDPLKRARRLAFSLARGRPGPMLPPEERPRIMARRGLELHATFDAMGVQIINKSHKRPPPLPPRRRWPKATITLL